MLLTSGKLYYELDAYRKAHNITDTAIVRLEQIYPVPRRKLAHLLDAYPKVTDFRWVQEEPANQGSLDVPGAGAAGDAAPAGRDQAVLPPGDGRAVGRFGAGARGRAGRGDRRCVLLGKLDRASATARSLAARKNSDRSSVLVSDGESRYAVSRE